MRLASSLLGIVAMLPLGACMHAGTPVKAPSGTVAGATISVAVGPCFGFCPVYKVSIAPDGVVTFDGDRNTAVLGERQRRADAALYREVAGELAPFKPADGSTERVACNAAISDTSSYTISWQTAGGEPAVATHQSGCTGGPGQTLDAVLRTLPTKLGIAQWAKQTTRPGTSRG